MKTILLQPSEIDQAVTAILEGHLIGFPTETVYGLGAVFDNEQALAKIFHTKGRPSDNPLILHIGHQDWSQQITRVVPEIAKVLMRAFFPGPLTLVLPKKSTLSSMVTGGRDSVAFRMPNHPLALEFIRKVNKPIAAPSANLSGKPSSTQSRHVMHDFNGKIAAVIEGGPSCLGIESTVLSLLDPAVPLILRPGSITIEMLQKVTGCEIKTLKGCDQENAKLSPGTRYRHYAPSARIEMLTTVQELEEHLTNSDGKAFLVPKGYPKSHAYMQEFTESNLYAFFRQCDEEEIHTIFVYLTEKETAQVALMNRLKKAKEN